MRLLGSCQTYDAYGRFTAGSIGLSPIFPSGRGIISHTARSVDFGLVTTRWLYRRQSLGWGDFPATRGSRWPLFLYRGVRWQPVLLGFDGGEPFASTRLVGTSQPTEGVWVFASPFVSLLYHRICVLSRPFLTFFVDSGSLTSGCLLTPLPAWGVSFCFPCGHRAGLLTGTAIGVGL